jgi:hypothetical protein
MSVLCAHCGQPVAGVAPGNIDGGRVFHGDCYRLEFPPEHPEDWPSSIQTASAALRDGWREDDG